MQDIMWLLLHCVKLYSENDLVLMVSGARIAQWYSTGLGGSSPGRG